jgi:hypothetical protein
MGLARARAAHVLDHVEEVSPYDIWVWVVWVRVARIRPDIAVKHKTMRAGVLVDVRLGRVLVVCIAKGGELGWCWGRWVVVKLSRVIIRVDNLCSNAMAAGAFYSKASALPLVFAAVTEDHLGGIIFGVVIMIVVVGATLAVCAAAWIHLSSATPLVGSKGAHTQADSKAGESEGTERQSEGSRDGSLGWSEARGRRSRDVEEWKGQARWVRAGKTGQGRTRTRLKDKAKGGSQAAKGEEVGNKKMATMAS